MSLNPLVTLKQPKQVSAQTRWGKKKRKEGPPLLVHIKRESPLKGIAGR